MIRNIFILSLAMFQLFALKVYAADPPPVDPKIEKQLQELDKKTEEVAKEIISENPDLEVQTTEDQIVIKKRTPPTTDEVDPAEHKRYENMQGIVNVFFAKGTTYVSNRTFDKYRNNGGPSEINTKSGHVMFGMGIRPPVRSLKRLMVGVDLGMESAGDINMSEEKHSLARGHNIKINFGYFGTWDVLVLNRARAIVSAGYRNAGYEIVDYSFGGRALDLSYAREHQGTVKWNQMLYTSAEGTVGLFAQYGRTSNGSNMITFGLNIMYGPEWPWLKRQKTK